MLSLLWLACAPADPTTGLDTSWSLVWEDTFDGAAGSPPDPARWTHNIGGDGWGNNQLEYNTDRTDNVRLSGDGTLEIVARAEEYEGNAYTSGRITTQDLFEQDYGRVEASIKLPAGQGLWPAFWMLGADIDEIGWPLCGEIDIMELRGEDPYESLGTIHGPGYSGGASLGSTYALRSGSFADDFHTFAVEVDPGHIAWFVDGDRYHVATRASLPPDVPWVYDNNSFFLILNLAVGGDFLAPPSADTPFPAMVEVDTVRVYERTSGYPE